MEQCFLLMKVTPGASPFLRIIPEDPPVATAGTRAGLPDPGIPGAGSPMASPRALCLF